MSVQRYYIPGSEWLYLKIYSGPKILEQFLIEEMYPKILQLIEQGLVNSFFFIRYNDPDYHIRLRLKVNSSENIGVVLNQLFSILDSNVNSNVFSNVSIDTYTRELERYGENLIEATEKVFFLDSVFILDYFSTLQSDMERWCVSCLYIDKLLDSINYSLEEKTNFCKHLSMSYIEELLHDQDYGKIQMDRLFRNNKKSITAAFETNSSSRIVENLLFYIDSILFYTSLQTKQTFDPISSIIHMHINRMFRTQQRLTECAIYGVLYRYYKSKQARLYKQ